MKTSLKEIVKVFPTLDPDLNSEEAVATIRCVALSHCQTYYICRLKTKAERIRIISEENKGSYPYYPIRLTLPQTTS